MKFYLIGGLMFAWFIVNAIVMMIYFGGHIFSGMIMTKHKGHFFNPFAGWRASVSDPDYLAWHKETFRRFMIIAIFGGASFLLMSGDALLIVKFL